ncbi:signal peptidase I [Enterococcus faecium]|uniref:Signal peptidase I n=1 Tax=Enterococcus faecium TaxID=1352 RepID=A0A242BG58_ENTFC|nr:signal peptidase I [Enterococcus faecium]OTN86664.1 signal peptidase I [Enterococcus faecium]OTN86677.1 signal peptidase I [Enterococcus faecium]OTN94483.1 signal peptidase I [Enterococcus faecium]
MNGRIHRASSIPTHKESPKRSPNSMKQQLRALLVKIVVIGGTLYILLSYLFGISFLKNNNMAPSIKFGDVALYVRLYQGIKVNDVVVYNDNGIERMGRIIAQPRDEVSITDAGKISVNGHEREEEFPQTTYAHSSGITYPYIVPEKSYFVMFDNRKEQIDSRYVGAIPQKDITGVVTTLIRVRDI